MIKPLDPRMYRPFTIWAAGMIEQTILKNESGISQQRSKGPWEEEELTELMVKWRGEIVEVEDAIINRDGKGMSKPLCCEENRTRENEQKLIEELFDVALYSAILASKFDPEMSQLRRGKIQ